MTINHQKSPSIIKSYARLIFSSRRGVPADGILPELSLEFENLHIDFDHLRRYKELCHFKQKEIPLTYPFVLADPLYLALLAHKSFPVKAAGLLHLRNHIKLISGIPTDSPLKLIVKTAGSRFRPQGFEFDVLTSLKAEGKEVWTCTATLLKKCKYEKEDPASPNENIFTKLQEKIEKPVSFSVPKNIGRQYARLCGDCNPIHISSLLAKLFGYKRSIAHGMWVSAAALSCFNSAEITIYDLAFKGPVFTGSEFSIQKAPNGPDFNIFTSQNPRPVILGKVT